MAYLYQGKRAWNIYLCNFHEWSLVYFEDNVVQMGLPIYIEFKYHFRCGAERWGQKPCATNLRPQSIPQAVSASLALCPTRMTLRGSSIVLPALPWTRQINARFGNIFQVCWIKFCPINNKIRYYFWRAVILLKLI